LVSDIFGVLQQGLGVHAFYVLGKLQHLQKRYLFNKDHSLLRTPIGERKNKFLLRNMQLYKDTIS